MFYISFCRGVITVSETKYVFVQFTYAGKSGFMVHMDPGGNVPSVVRFAVNLVRWPEWASALRIFSGYLLTLHNVYLPLFKYFLSQT